MRKFAQIECISTSTPATKGVQETQNSTAKVPSLSSRQIVIQPQLELTQSGDSYEREADCMADFVMSKAFSSRVNLSLEYPSRISALPSIISRRVDSSSGVAVDAFIEDGINASQGSGHPLPDVLRSKMETAFDSDFSRVRLHTDSRAAELSSGISAKAFTYGNDIYFNRGQYQPYSTEGLHLLAHELTHVVQQNGKVARKVIATSDSQKENRRRGRSKNKEENALINLFFERRNTTFSIILILLSNNKRAKSLFYRVLYRGAPLIDKEKLPDIQKNDNLLQEYQNDLYFSERNVSDVITGKDSNNVKRREESLSTQIKRVNQIDEDLTSVSLDIDTANHVLKLIDDDISNSIWKASQLLCRVLKDEIVKLNLQNSNKSFSFDLAKKLKEDNWFTSSVSEFIGGVDFPEEKIKFLLKKGGCITEELKSLLTKFELANENFSSYTIQGFKNIVTFVERNIQEANNSFYKVEDLIYEYREGTITGAERTVTGLRVTRDVSSTIALSIATGGALAAVSGGARIAHLATKAPKVAKFIGLGLKEGIIGGVASAGTTLFGEATETGTFNSSNVLKSGILGFVGGAAGASLGGAFNLWKNVAPNSPLGAFVEIGEGVLGDLAENMAQRLFYGEEEPFCNATLLFNLIPSVSLLRARGHSSANKLLERGATLTSKPLEKGATSASKPLDKLFVPARNRLGGVFTSVKNRLGGGFTSVKNRLGEVFTSVKNRLDGVFTSVTNRLGEVFTSVKNRLTGVFTSVKNRLAGVFTSVKNRLAGVFTSVKNRLAGVFTSVKNRLAGVFTSVKNRLAGVFTSVKNRLAGVFTSVKNRLGEVFTSVKNRLGEVFTSVKNRLAGVFTSVKNQSGEVFTSVKNRLGEVFTSVKNRLGEVFASVKNLFKKGVIWVKNLLKRGVAWIKNLLKKGVAWVKEIEERIVIAVANLEDFLGWGFWADAGQAGAQHLRWQNTETYNSQYRTYSLRIPLSVTGEKVLIQKAILFETGKYDLSTKGRIDIGSIAEIITKYQGDSNVYIHLKSYASPLWKDSISRADAQNKNKILSQKRIDSVECAICEQIIPNKRNGATTLSHTITTYKEVLGSERLSRQINPQNNSSFYRKVEVVVYVNQVLF